MVVGCTVATAVCVVVNVAIVGYNAYYRYQQYGNSSKFYVGTALDSAAALVNMRSLNGFVGMTDTMQDRFGNVRIQDAGPIRGITEVPARVVGKTVAYNVSVASATSIGDNLGQYGYGVGYQYFSGR